MLHSYSKLCSNQLMKRVIITSSADVSVGDLFDELMKF